MKGLHVYLPPFASDIAGACSALFGLKGLVVVHEPACCTSSYTAYDEPRYYGSSSALYSSELREIHLSTGDDETILRRIEAAVKTVDCSFIAVIESPVPRFAGTDYRALARIAEKRTGLPCLFCDTSGFEWYHMGESSASLEIARLFVKPVSEAGRDGASVNILGLSAFETSVANNRKALFDEIERKGFSVLSAFTLGSSLEDISKAVSAVANIVVSSSGIETARYLESNYGIPYITGVPIGTKASERLFDALASAIEGHEPPCKISGRNAKGSGKALIAGEEIFALSLRECLIEDLGFAEVTLASFFAPKRYRPDKGVVRMGDEDSFAALCGANAYDLVIGDPLFKAFFPNAGKTRFIPMPQVGVSGYDPKDEGVNLIGEEGRGFFGNLID